MRTTISLDDDVARAVDVLRRQRGLGTSAALNLLARRGLTQGDAESEVFTQRVSSLGPARIPLDDIGAALEVLEGEAHGG